MGWGWACIPACLPAAIFNVQKEPREIRTALASVQKSSHTKRGGGEDDLAVKILPLSFRKIVLRIRMFFLKPNLTNSFQDPPKISQILVSL